MIRTVKSVFHVLTRDLQDLIQAIRRPLLCHLTKLFVCFTRQGEISRLLHLFVIFQNKLTPLDKHGFLVSFDGLCAVCKCASA